MFNFGLSQNLSRVLFLSIGVSLLLVLSVPTAAAVNSPTLTVLDMEEMSQIAGGSVNCYDIGSTKGGESGFCKSTGSICPWPSYCGTTPYVKIYGNQYCKIASTGHYDCRCSTHSPGWKMWYCEFCTLDYECTNAFAGQGGNRIRCNLSIRCP